jgi:hypothetical protein
MTETIVKETVQETFQMLAMLAGFVGVGALIEAAFTFATWCAWKRRGWKESRFGGDKE